MSQRSFQLLLSATRLWGRRRLWSDDLGDRPMGTGFDSHEGQRFSQDLGNHGEVNRAVGPIIMVTDEDP